MPTQITNQATLSFNYGDQTGTAISNVTTATLLDRLGIDKNSLSTTYRVGDDITYIVTVTNTSGGAVSNVTVTDDLGAYMLGTVRVVPLTYLPPVQLYVDGVYESTLEASAGDDGVVFTIPLIPADSTANLIYRATVNASAPVGEGGEITNTVTLGAASAANCGGGGTVSASYTITAEDYADVRIIKSMSPDPISEGDRITYTFDIYNYGNVDATDVVLTDVFDPAPTDITVFLDGSAVIATSYTYIDGTLIFPIEQSPVSITVPAATSAQNPATGVVTVTPGRVTITVTGTL